MHFSGTDGASKEPTRRTAGTFGDNNQKGSSEHRSGRRSWSAPVLRPDEPFIDGIKENDPLRITEELEAPTGGRAAFGPLQPATEHF